MNVLEKYENFESKHPYATSVGEAAVAYAVKAGVRRIGAKYGVELGHGRKNNKTRGKIIEEHPVAAAAAATIAAPAAEELLYRHLPAKGLDKVDGLERGSLKRSLVEMGITGLFAAQHAGKDGIPLTSLIGGLVYQRAYNRRGLGGSVAAHVTNNALAAVEHLAKKEK